MKKENERTRMVLKEEDVILVNDCLLEWNEIHKQIFRSKNENAESIIEKIKNRKNNEISRLSLNFDEYKILHGAIHDRIVENRKTCDNKKLKEIIVYLESLIFKNYKYRISDLVKVYT